LILDLEKSMAIEAHGYDVCVIGAGAARIVLALDLAQRGMRTLLLEAGVRVMKRGRKICISVRYPELLTKGYMMAGFERSAARRAVGQTNPGDRRLYFPEALMGRGLALPPAEAMSCGCVLVCTDLVVIANTPSMDKPLFLARRKPSGFGGEYPGVIRRPR
jgi:hypothetical protein